MTRSRTATAPRPHRDRRLRHWYPGA